MAERSRTHPWIAVAAVAAVIAGVTLTGWGRGDRPEAAASGASPRRAWWYWHHPFRLSTDEVTRLRSARCDRLYVHAGNVDESHGALTLTGRQRFETAAPCDLFAVLRIHPRAHAALVRAGGAAALAGLLRDVSLPEGVRGVQLDADIPTAQLADFTRFLADLRGRLPDGWALSVTALPDWLRSRDYPRLCSGVDEIAPQFYGNRWPSAGKPPPPLWETDHLLEQVRRSACGPARVWVGLPSYGRCVVLDPSGRPVGVRHDIDPERLLDDPDWSAETAVTRDAPKTIAEALHLEDSLSVHADRDAEAGPMLAEAGITLWFQWPRVSALERVSRSIEALREPRVAGVCFFRWPAPGEPLAVDLAPARNAAEPGLTVTATRRERDVTITVTNRGADPPLLPDGVRVEIVTGGAEVEAASEVEYRLGETPCSPLRADRAVLSRAVLRPGARWNVGRVREASGAVSVRAFWRDDRGQEQVATAEIQASTHTASGRSPERSVR